MINLFDVVELVFFVIHKNKQLHICSWN